MQYRRFLFIALVAGLIGFAAENRTFASDTENVIDFDDPVEYNAPYLATPMAIVERMLEFAEVKSGDVVYDLGSGDGRIVITAAKKFGARGVGLEIDPELVKQARVNAERAGVRDLVEFRVQDIFTADFSNASVVTLYLLPETNAVLRQKLEAQLRPGTRIVSHDFGIGDWQPDNVREFSDVEGSLYTLLLWRIPPKAIDRH
jgi:SAM-dependent methyltransferase